jgi:hypothetical protein
MVEEATANRFKCSVFVIFSNNKNKNTTTAKNCYFFSLAARLPGWNTVFQVR